MMAANSNEPDPLPTLLRRGAVIVSEVAVAASLIYFLGQWGSLLVLLSLIAVVTFSPQGKWLGATQGSLSALLLIILFFAVAEFALAAYKHELPDELGDYRGGFFSTQTLRNVAAQASTIGVAALGMTLIIIAGGIDLSAGTALSLGATVLARLLLADQPVWISIAIGIGVGVLCGLLNGAMIAMARIVPFIVTLGTMLVFVGLGKIIAEETTVRPKPVQVPEWMSKLVAIEFDGGNFLIEDLLPKLCVGFAFFVFLTILTEVLLRCTVFGRYIFAIGSNEAAARLSGISITRMKIAIYATAGLYVGLAGMYQFAKLSSGSPTEGQGLELRIIAAVVIGGASLNGGRGTVVGTLIGAIMTTVIRLGCTNLGLRDPLQDIILGGTIIAAVFVDQMRQRRV